MNLHNIPTTSDCSPNLQKSSVIGPIGHPISVPESATIGLDGLADVSSHTNAFPSPPARELCCGSGCPNCVWIQYAEEVMQYVKDIPLHDGVEGQQKKIVNDALKQNVEDDNLRVYLLMEIRAKGREMSRCNWREGSCAGGMLLLLQQMLLLSMLLHLLLLPQGTNLHKVALCMSVLLQMLLLLLPASLLPQLRTTKARGHSLLQTEGLGKDWVPSSSNSTMDFPKRFDTSIESTKFDERIELIRAHPCLIVVEHLFVKCQRALNPKCWDEPDLFTINDVNEVVLQLETLTFRNKSEVRQSAEMEMVDERLNELCEKFVQNYRERVSKTFARQMDLLPADGTERENQSVPKAKERTKPNANGTRSNEARNNAGGGDGTGKLAMRRGGEHQVEAVHNHIS
uniref:Oxidoreductase-like domain-containing protein n=1 Tax=Globodera rostochiensis TaxID=31243 RepID=A0A914H3K1_GLORO